MGIKNDCRKNAEGYSDPTAYEALKNIEQEEDRFHKLLETIFTLCELSDFHIEERIVIKDKRTGRIWTVGIRKQKKKESQFPGSIWDVFAEISKGLLR